MRAVSALSPPGQSQAEACATYPNHYEASGGTGFSLCAPHDVKIKIMRTLALLLASAAILSADEGMWTFDNPPAKLIQDKYHFTLTKQWLDHVRLASARLNDGGSGSFVSPHGLLLTNHHVAREQLQKSSTAEHDYIANGFLAKTQAEEIKSP